MISDEEKVLWGCRDSARIAAYFACDPEAWHFGNFASKISDINRHAASIWRAFDNELASLPPGYTFDAVELFLRECSEVLYTYATAKVMPLRDHRAHYLGLASKIGDVADNIRHDADMGAWERDGQLSRSMDWEGARESLERLFERKGINLPDGWFGGVYDVFLKHSPTMLEALEGLQANARMSARAGPLSMRPNSKNAPRVYFIRRMSAWLRNRFQAPLHGELAAVANALFPDLPTIDAIYVQKTARPPEAST